MFERAVERYRKINRPGEPEDSIGFRVAVLVAVLISVYAAVRYGAIGVPVGVAVMTGIILGSCLSYLSRGRENLFLKFVLSLLLIAAFVLFWSEFAGSANDMRYPLVRLFLWLQVLHSFDLPTRRDLDFSLISAAILISFAGSLSTSNDFLYVLAAFFVCGLISLYLGQRSALKRSADVYIVGSGASPKVRLALAGLVLLPLSVAIFAVLPRLPGFNSYNLPVSNSKPLSSEFDAFINNPGYGDVPESFPSEPLPFNRDSYFGFSKYLDLRVRGVPADETVMKVRSAEPSYWRSTAFDVFLGNGWENAEKSESLEEISSESLPLEVSYPGEPGRYATEELVQTFFIEKRLPNTVFASYIPRGVYFPTRVLKVDSMMTVLAPVQLDPGLIYTVVSEVSSVTPEMLRNARGVLPEGMRERFCQLPEMSDAVAELAERITAGEPTDFDKVEALSEYLKANYPYNLDCPKQGNGENTVEFFLFKAKRGYCEHFATTLAVMCRTIGLPARVAVGFATGDYNPLTGYYEVSGRDAHAWVEVYFPVFGWTPFDPTPGWEDPFTLPDRDTTWAGFALLQRIGRGLSRVFPSSWARAFTSAGKTLVRWISAAAARTAAFVSDAWPWLLAIVILIPLGTLLARRRRNGGRETSPRAAPSTTREKACEQFSRMTAVLEGVGFKRERSQTPAEFGVEVSCDSGIREAARAASLFERLRFGPEPSVEDLLTLEELVDTVEDAFGGRRHRGIRHLKFRPKEAGSGTRSASSAAQE